MRQIAILFFTPSTLPTARAILAVGLRRVSLHHEEQDRYLENPERGFQTHLVAINLQTPIAAEARRCI
ncbi:MAG: hypothetical protein ACREIH_09930 [Nitrospiraceae bacterium]